MSGLFTKESVFTATLLSFLAWGGITITELKAATAVNSSHAQRIESIIPKISNSLIKIDTSLGHVEDDIGEIKQSQKDYQVQFNKRLDKLRT